MNKEQQEVILEAIDRVMKAAAELQETVKKAAEEPKRRLFGKYYDADVIEIIGIRGKVELLQIALESKHKECEELRQRCEKLEDERNQLLRSREILREEIMKRLEADE